MQTYLYYFDFYGVRDVNIYINFRISDYFIHIILYKLTKIYKCVPSCLKGIVDGRRRKIPIFVMRCYLYKLRILVFFLIYLYVCQN